jgi:general nucleoside transport system ATP-binding protein
MTPARPPPVLEVADLVKDFGAFRALDGVSLRVAPGTVHAVLGENGAGKSTLVKCVMGYHRASSGRVVLDGIEVTPDSPRRAQALGIGMVYQHFTLVPNLTVAENLVVARADLPFVLDWRTEVRALEAFMARAPFRVPLDAPVRSLAAGEKQKLEILKQLYLESRIMILDEPTSVLTPQEAEQLFRTLRVLRKEGRAILYISHKLEEVRALCDTATILRGGKVIATCDPRAETAQSLASMMVGGEVGVVRSDGNKKMGLPRLVVRNLDVTPEDPHGTKLDAITFELAAGEILGIAGVAGNGQDELFAALSGEVLADKAAIRIDGKDAGRLSITERRRLGAAFVPEERLGHATAPRFRLSENALISGHAASPMVRGGFIDRGQMLAFVERITKAYDVRKGKRDPEAVSLSGGNLQKYVVGREILREPRLLIVSQPTWGVDAGAAAAIRQAIIDLAARGAAVLVMSQDLDELYEISDRLVVICAGRLSAPRATRRADRGEIGMLMAGVGMKGLAHAARA